MIKLHKAARQAIDALQEARDHIYLSPDNEQNLTDAEILEKVGAAIISLHNALTHPEDESKIRQEPVGHVTDSGTSAYILDGVDLEDDTPLYIGPKRWVGLTDDEREHFRKLGFVGVLAVEAKLKEKNS